MNSIIWAGGGDSSVTLERMKRDLPQFNPTLVTIKLGMNDGGYTLFRQDILDKYINGYRQLLDFLRSYTKARIVLITTVPYETDVSPVWKRDNKEIDMSVYPETLRRLSRGVEELAKEYKTGFIDLNDLYQKDLTESKAKDAGFKLSGDAIHPDVNGQSYMAYHILKGLNAPALISELVIDAKAGKTVSEKGSFVRNMAVKDNVLTFARQDRSLPFRFSGEEQWNQKLIQKEKWYNDLNRDLLTVKNWEQPFALLSIDGEAAAVLSKEQLEGGFNLSLLPKSALLKQGAMIAELTEKRHAAEYTRWRRYLLAGVGSPYDFTPYKPETIFSQYQKELVDFYHQLQLKYNNPVLHQFTLTGGEKEALEPALKK